MDALGILKKLKDFFGRAFKYRAVSGGVDYTLKKPSFTPGTLAYSSYHNLNRGYRRVSSFGEGWNYVRYIKEYELMDKYDIISAALDIYASEATFKDLTTGKTVWVVSDDKSVQELLNNLFARIEIEDYIYEIARNIAKYGNDYSIIVFSKDLSRIEFLDYVHPINMRVVRHEGLYYYLCILDQREAETIDQYGAEDIVKSLLSKGKKVVPGQYVVFEPWFVLHFALSSRQRSDLYGTSILDSVVVTWRRLAYLENAMWFKKLRESVTRYLYYVQIGEYEVESARAKLDEFTLLLKTASTFSSQLSNFNYRYDTWLEDEDLYIPVRSERDATRIETLDARQYDVMEEIDYFVSKIAGGLRIPKSYLLFNEQTDKTTLGMQDMRFAKSVMRLQDAIIRGLNKLCDIELLLNGYDPLAVNYQIKIPRPSLIFELANWDAERQKLEVAEGLLRFFPKEWILKHFFKLSNEEIMEIKDLESGNEIDFGEGSETIFGGIGGFEINRESGKGEKMSGIETTSSEETSEMEKHSGRRKERAKKEKGKRQEEQGTEAGKGGSETKGKATEGKSETEEEK